MEKTGGSADVELTDEEIDTLVVIADPRRGRGRTVVRHNGYWSYVGVTTDAEGTPEWYVMPATVRRLEALGFLRQVTGGSAITNAARAVVTARRAAIAAATEMAASLLPPEQKARRDGYPALRGICHVWIKNVRLLGHVAPPGVGIAAGTIGDMEVLELSHDGRVINARFHPSGVGHGYGLVVVPSWEYVMEPSIAEFLSKPVSP